MNAIKKTIGYFYNEHYNGYFGVSSYKLDKEGNYAGGIPSGVYNKEKMDLNKIPYLGIKKENKNINYL